MLFSADYFIVTAPNCASDTIILGRNVIDESQKSAAVVEYYDANVSTEGKCDGGAEPETAVETLRIILQKSTSSIWGGDYGANEYVTMGITWSAQDIAKEKDHLIATDIVRLTLATVQSSKSAADRIGALVEIYGVDGAKCNFVACDASEVWCVSCSGKLWAAECLTESCLRIPNNGLTVNIKIDKSCIGVHDAVKALGWNGEGELDFAKCLSASANPCNDWCGVEPHGDEAYSLTNMFETLRSAPTANGSLSSVVSVLTSKGISSHWFTGTPNTNESVFKPFVFSPNPKISPLTKVTADNATTLLHKLHAQRKSAAVNDLKNLENACVFEVGKYLCERPTADEELDELMKDCVEAEVKFYR